MKGAGQTLGAKMHLAKWHTFLIFWVPAWLLTTVTLVWGKFKDLPVSTGALGLILPDTGDLLQTLMSRGL